MPEQIIWTATPLREAIDKVTNNNQREWRFRSFTINDKQWWNGQHVKTGVRIKVLHPKRGWQNVTIRDDYDFAQGGPPAGKGYHVNVELPGEKIAYCDNHRGGKALVENLWAHITERASVDGDEQAAQWYMNNKRYWG